MAGIAAKNIATRICRNKITTTIDALNAECNPFCFQKLKGRPTYKRAGDKFDLYKRAGDKFDLSKRAGDEFNF